LSSLLNRLKKIEAKHSNKNEPNWMFITMVASDKADKIMNVQDINPHSQLGSLENKDKLPCDEFLAECSKQFNMDFKDIYYRIDDKDAIGWKGHIEIE